jgi:hypothetical protein
MVARGVKKSKLRREPGYASTHSIENSKFNKYTRPLTYWQQCMFIGVCIQGEYVFMKAKEEAAVCHIVETEDVKEIFHEIIM